MALSVAAQPRHAPGAESSEEARPNVLFIAVDDLNDWITLLDPEAVGQRLRASEDAAGL